MIASKCFRVIIGLLLLCMHRSTTAQTITTIAGDGVMAVTGDGGPATLASIHQPNDLCVDATGNLFFCFGAGGVRKIDNAGIITHFAGGGTGGDGSPATAALLGSPVLGISTDGAGNMYLAAGCRVRKIDAAGIIATVAGSGSTASGTCAIAYTGDGGPATTAVLKHPAVHTAFDAAGNLYVSFHNHMRRVSTSGIIHTVAGTNVDGFSGDGGPATAAQMGVLGHVVPDAFGNIYFADMTNNRIRRIDAAGIITTIAGNGVAAFGGDGGPATAASFDYPNDLAFDPWGNLYVCDLHNNRVRRIDPAGIITTFAGTGAIGYSGDGGPATAATFNGPTGIAINQEGDVYISDGTNRRIRKISSWNSRPWFTHGEVVSFTACGEYNPTDTLLRVMESNASQPITWSLLSPPAHGVAVAAYSTTATGGVLTPVGTGYTPAGAYTGPDTFRVRVFDGGAYDTITVAVDVQAVPIAAPLTGTDTLCVGDTAPLSGATPGGVWSSSSGSATVTASGTVTGISTGTAVITYVVTNTCGTATATHTVTVLPAGECATGLSAMSLADAFGIYPNPNTGSFTVLLPQGTSSHITIADVTGRVVQQLTASNTTQVHLPAANGLYFVAVENGQGRYYGKVMVK
jgi:hypothetical protein